MKPWTSLREEDDLEPKTRMRKAKKFN